MCFHDVAIFIQFFCVSYPHRRHLVRFPLANPDEKHLNEGVIACFPQGNVADGFSSYSIFTLTFDHVRMNEAKIQFMSNVC